MRTCLMILILLIYPVCAETYFIMDHGTASISAAAQSNGGSCTDEAHAMSISTHNSASFAPGDTIYICGDIIDSGALIPPSSGTATSRISYRGDHSSNPGTFKQGMMSSPNVKHHILIKNVQYIDIKNIDFESDVSSDYDVHNRAAIWFEEWYEPTGHVTVDDCQMFQTTSGLQIIGDVKHVDLIKSHVSNMVDNGVGVGRHWSGSSYTGVKYRPSYITIGGSREDGNTFVNIGRINGQPDSGEVPGMVFGTQATDSVFSYNHVYADEIGWGTGVYINGVEKILVEYNYIHDLDSAMRRPAISLKSDRDWKNSDIIIRFNKVGPTHGNINGFGTYVNPDSGIRFNNCLDNVAVYGNYVKDVVDFGLMSTWGWSQDWSSDGCIPENTYVFSNIVARTETASGMYMAGTSGTDHFKNFYVTNNLFYHVADENLDDHPTNSYGIQSRGSDRNYQEVYFMNNIIDKPRQDSADHIGISVPEQADIYVDYNHHYFPGAIPQVSYEGSDCTPCAWNSQDRPAGYGLHDSEGDPTFSDASNSDFTLTEDSPCVDSGVDLHVRTTITIQGVDHEISLGIGLDPDRTDWTSTIPVVHTLEQDDYGNWEKGPYVYVDSRCIPDWHCSWSDWSACADGEQTRTETCSDSNSCDRPSPAQTEYRACAGYRVYKTYNSPDIDGSLDEFQGAEQIMLSNSHGTVGSYRLMWDEQYMYIAAEVQDDMLNSMFTDAAGDLWADDALEIMFDTANDKGDRMNSNDYKIFINSLGTVKDTRIFDDSWNSGIESFVVADGTNQQNADTDNGYVIEARLPLMSSVDNGSLWGMNLVLNDKHSVGTEDVIWSGDEVNKPDSWSPIVFIDEGCDTLNTILDAIYSWKRGEESLDNLIRKIYLWLYCA